MVIVEVSGLIEFDFVIEGGFVIMVCFMIVTDDFVVVNICSISDNIGGFGLLFLFVLFYVFDFNDVVVIA